MIGIDGPVGKEHRRGKTRGNWRADAEEGEGGGRKTQCERQEGSLHCLNASSPVRILSTGMALHLVLSEGP